MIYCAFFRRRLPSSKTLPRTSQAVYAIRKMSDVKGGVDVFVNIGKQNINPDFHSLETCTHKLQYWWIESFSIKLKVSFKIVDKFRLHEPFTVAFFYAFVTNGQNYRLRLKCNKRSIESLLWFEKYWRFWGCESMMSAIQTRLSEQWSPPIFVR